MPYSTVAEVRAAVSPLSGGTPDPPTEVSNTAADLSNAVLLDQLAEADSTINAYISGRYITPVALVSGIAPAPLCYWSRNIAAYLATLVFRNSLDFTDTDPIARRYIATMLALTAVRDGKMPLPVPPLGSDGDGMAAEGVGPALNQYEGWLFSANQWDLSPDGCANRLPAIDGTWVPWVPL